MPFDQLGIAIEDLYAPMRQLGYHQVADERCAYLLPWNSAAVGREELMDVFKKELHSMDTRLNLVYLETGDQGQAKYGVNFMGAECFFHVYVFPRKRCTYGDGDDSYQI